MRAPDAFLMTLSEDALISTIRAYEDTLDRQQARIRLLEAANAELLRVMERAIETFDDSAPGHGMTPRKCIALMRDTVHEARPDARA